MGTQADDRNPSGAATERRRRYEPKAIYQLAESLRRQGMDLARMREEIARQLHSKSSRVVFVDAHPDVDYARVVEMIDAVRAAGADTVGMATLKTNDEFNACSPFVAAVVPAEGDAAATNTAPPPQ